MDDLMSINNTITTDDSEVIISYGIHFYFLKSIIDRLYTKLVEMLLKQEVELLI